MRSLVFVAAVAMALGAAGGFVFGMHTQGVLSDLVLQDIWPFEQRDTACDRVPFELDPVLDLGCDTPMLRLFVEAFVPEAEMEYDWSEETQVLGCITGCYEVLERRVEESKDAGTLD